MGVRSGNYACSPRSRREMLGSLFVHERGLRRAAARAHGRLGLRLPAQSPPSASSSGAPDEPRTEPSWIVWRLLTQTEQPRSSPSFQGTAPAERATARRAKSTPRWELATAGMRRRRAPEVRLPPPPSERRRHRRVCLGEPPATVAVPLYDAALGQSAEPHGDPALVAAGCLRPLHDASLRILAHRF
jgi:hypothetical protein